jgi:membrane protease YdiL (CAAX protease family)
MLASWLWRLAARRFGGLGVPLASHAVADAAIATAATIIAFGG